MAGKGFTVKKNWDKPREHAMPAAARPPLRGVRPPVSPRSIPHATLFSTAAALPPSLGATVSVGNESVPIAPESIESNITNTRSGCGLLMTEFTSADGLARMRETKRQRYLTFYDDKHP